jgi:hypothetical protein
MAASTAAWGDKSLEARDQTYERASGNGKKKKEKERKTHRLTGQDEGPKPHA